MLPPHKMEAEEHQQKQIQDSLVTNKTLCTHTPHGEEKRERVISPVGLLVSTSQTWRRVQQHLSHHRFVAVPPPAAAGAAVIGQS